MRAGGSPERGRRAVTRTRPKPPARYLVTARAESGMTFEQLAEASGLHRQTLTNIARGAAKGDLRTWLMLARAFDATLDELLAPVWHDSAS
ncbi:helix-turn-helix transcriptional regulator [Dermacoccus nishinomiyaensis]|uniref:helix-turn-helix transcriptional regulator n=2 Tax=Dermacoccus nishinomiyaensis TaxID=1274 RepID=UPI002114A6D4|nr:helix-turn-helix transcriptional regulator [Dermacoccus nishinomiyaensis]